MPSEIFKWQGNNENQKEYCLILDATCLKIEGNFYEVLNREIVSSKKSTMSIPLDEYLGSSNLKIKSEKKFNDMLIPYAILTVIRIIIDKITSLIGFRDNVVDIVTLDVRNIVGNFVIGAIQNIIPIPYPLDIFNIFICGAQILLIIFAIRYWLSEKDVYEFTGKRNRFAIDKKSLSGKAYFELLTKIKNLKEKNNVL